MRPGNRWTGEAANPLVAAVYGAIVALAVGFLLSFALGRIGIWVVHGRNAWDSPSYLMRSALNLYAEQHVPLVGSGTVASELARQMQVSATMSFPITLCALIPIAGLMLGGYTAARSRIAAGRWGMIGPALASGVIYTIVLAVAARFISAHFTSAALPEVTTPTMSTQFRSPDMPFHPSIAGTLTYGTAFALLASYLGALVAARSCREPKIAGKWWACGKAVVITALVIQLAIAGTALVEAYRSDAVADTTRTEFAAVLPTVAGMGYSLLYGAKLSYGARFSAEGTSQVSGGEFSLYKGSVTTSGGKVNRRPSQFWYLEIVAILVALVSGRMAVRYGSRDGSLPTAVRIAFLQAGYLALQMVFSGMSLGYAVVGGTHITLFAQPRYDSAMLFTILGVLVMALGGAHWANRRYVGRLSGFPTA